MLKNVLEICVSWDLEGAWLYFRTANCCSEPTTLAYGTDCNSSAEDRNMCFINIRSFRIRPTV